MRLNKKLAFSCMSLTLACTGAAKADSFSTGQFVTYSDNDWGSGAVSTSVLVPDYDSTFASNDDLLVVGVPGVPNEYFMSFATASEIRAYLPATGSPGPLIASLVNPTSSPAGLFGGDDVALTLNIAFNEAGYLQGSSSTPFGELVLTNFTGSLSGLNGLTVSQFLTIANVCLGGGACPDGGLDNIASVADSLNLSFEAGTPDTFADTNLALPGSGTPAPEPSSLLLLAPGLASLGFLRRRRILRE